MHTLHVSNCTAFPRSFAEACMCGNQNMWATCAIFSCWVCFVFLQGHSRISNNCEHIWRWLQQRAGVSLYMLSLLNDGTSLAHTLRHDMLLGSPSCLLPLEGFQWGETAAALTSPRLHMVSFLVGFTLVLVGYKSWLVPASALALSQTIRRDTINPLLWTLRQSFLFPSR